MSVIHAPKEPELDLRQAAFLVLVGLALLVMLLRLWYIQVVMADELANKASSIRTVEVPKLAPRGLIFDRRGVPLARVQGQMVVTAVPSIVDKQPWVLGKLAEMLGADEADLKEKVEAGAWRKHFPTPVHVGASVEVATKIAEAGEYLPGIGVDTQAMRTYPDTLHYSHILGYVWTPSDRDVKRLEDKGIADVADYVGKDGIERIYEKELMGAEGFDTFEVDARRRPVRAVEGKAPVPGSKLILSIDSRLQKVAYEQLRGRRGAVVAIEPKTGEVLCLASGPTYDSALFEGGISTANWTTLRSDPATPLNNRATSSSYSPGSTFKIVTTFASVLAGQFSTNRAVSCPGYYQIGNRRVRCENHAPGTVRFHTAFEKSCNTYFVTLAYDAGMDKLREAAFQVGLGKKTGIDLPSESKGLIPTLEWLHAVNPEAKWYPGDTVNAAIGQGYVSTTPLQMATLAALVANRGVSYQPHLLKAISPPGGSTKPDVIAPKELGRFEAPTELWDDLQSAMVDVIQRGTGRRAQIPGVVWGGKTGSTEHRKGSKTHGWFVGIAPMDDPKIVIAVIIEAAGHGGEVAAPVAKAVVETYLGKAPKAPATSENALMASATPRRLDSSAPVSR